MIGQLDRCLILAPSETVSSKKAKQVGVREVFQAAVMTVAVSVVVGHNHTSGQVAPSPEDKTVTTRLCQAGELLGIRVLDHLVIGNDQSFSFREQGQLTT